MGFYEDMKNNQKIETENGAIAYATSGKALLNLNFAVGSLRGASEQEILNLFTVAYRENPTLAIRWLFFARDIKEGLGERNLFRVCLNYLIRNAEAVKWSALFTAVEVYGRYDDFVTILNNETLSVADRASIIEIISAKLSFDALRMAQGKSISLLAKWMPSINTSSAKTRALAREIAKGMKISYKDYRQFLARLRAYSNVTEVKTSANEWNKIEYAKVPSYANLKYKNAFYTHDRERYEAFLASVEKGETKINASVLYPYDIVNQYPHGGGWYYSEYKYDATLEALWANLPDREIENTLVVADGSGSMTCNVGSGNMTALDVANSLAIYFAEHNKGEFANKYITFSHRPQFVDFTGKEFLCDKLTEARKHYECSNTNIEAVFDLILSTAKKKNIPQSEMPKNILILSDMEFDFMVNFGEFLGDEKTLFENIAERYKAAGYKLPRLVFWNINSRTRGIPLQENELGVALVSGFSTTIADMVMSGQTDPYEVLLDKLDNYEEVDDIFTFKA